MRVAIVTVSDSVSQGSREDLSGPGLRECCGKLGWVVISMAVVADDEAAIVERLVALADFSEADLILTTGGTGIGPRDVTPEATMTVAGKTLPGLGEQMRVAGLRATPRAALSRAVAAVRGRKLIVNLPGSPRGAVESLEAIAELLPHAVEVLRGASHG